MMYNIANMLSRALLVLTLIALAVARPQHLGDTNQIANDQDASANILSSSGLSDMQLELLAQRLAEYQNQIPSAWDRILRLPEKPWERMQTPEKRQSRFRQCYFNPVSCFKK